MRREHLPVILTKSLATPSQLPPTISVVTPVYGCSACLEDLVDRVASALKPLGEPFEMILVDDASPDGAWRRINELAEDRPWLKGLKLSRNFGQHYAIAAGIEESIGARVVVMDCDLQDVPEEIPALLSALGADIDVVFAQRTSRQDAWLKRLASWAFFRLLTWLTGVQQDHTTANFGAYRRNVIEAVNRMPERERCFPLMVKWAGFRSVHLPVQHSARAAGRSGYSFHRLLRLATNIVLSYSDKPLRLVVGLGLMFSVIAFVMVGLSIFRFLNGDVQVAGFTSVVASIWLVGGVTLFCLGIVGLYVGKQFNDSKGRPYYIVSERTTFGENPENSRIR